MHTYELATSWLLRAPVDDHHNIDFARLARLPTLIGRPNSACSFIPRRRHHPPAAPQSSMHVAFMHALSNIRILPTHRYQSSIRPHVIRQACHRLSHQASLARARHTAHLGQAEHLVSRWDGLLCSLPSTATTIFNKASCFHRWTAGLTAHTYLFNYLLFVPFKWRSLELDGNIYPRAAAHLRA